jgi:hypothetical protein
VLLISAKLLARLMSEESLAEQTAFLVETLCPNAEDPALCEAVIGVHWAVIGPAMYPTFLEANSVCSTLGACSAARNVVREWTCEDCTGGISGIADVVVASIPEIIEFLKVTYFNPLIYITFSKPLMSSESDNAFLLDQINS